MLSNGSSKLTPAKRLACAFFAVVLALGLVPCASFAQGQEDAGKTVAPRAVSNTYGTADSAVLVQDKLGESVSTANGVEDGYLSLVGPYQFNVTGNTNVRGKFDAAIGQSVHSSRVPDEQALVGYAMANMGAATNVGGTATAGHAAGTNSSSARLVKGSGDNITVQKAYLVVAASQCNNWATTPATTPLSHYGVSFMGPSGTVNRFFPDVVYTDGPMQRSSCFFDVTDLVKKEGYGWYTAINIPCTTRDTSNSAGGDYFASWKLVVVEENVDLKPRMLRLKLGGTTVQNGSPATVTISGEGLSVVGEPKGELVVAMDGSDFGDSNQNLSYQAKNGTASSVSGNIANTAKLRSAAKFFSLRVDNRDLLDDASDFDPAPKQSDNSALSGLNGNKNINLHNTDLTVMDVEKRGSASNPDGMVLNGGETEVSLNAVTNLNPTILTVLGLALEIVTPDFNTTLQIANLTKHYATSDRGYEVSPTSEFYADEGDALRATMLCENTSPETKQYLGLSSPKAQVTVNGFKDIDESSITAFFAAKDGEKYRMSNESVVKNADGSFTVTAEGFKDDAPGQSTVITTQGYFEISFNGTAQGTRTFQSYSNRASIQGNFVDENNGFHNFLLTNLGLATVTTASNEPRYALTATGVGSGSGTVTGTGSYFGTDEPEVTWTADEGSHVASVFVDSAVRDDLVHPSDEDGQAPTSVTIPMDDKAHDVVVVFEKDGESGSGDGDEGDEGDHFSVTSVADGGIASITPSATVEAGDDAVVTWKVKPGYKVSTVLVDGVAIAAADAGSVAFSDIASSHTVQVLTERVGSTADGLPYVKTSLAGEGTITPSAAVEKGSDYDVSFKPSHVNSVLSRVVLNGKELYNEYLYNPKTGNAANDAFLAQYSDGDGGFKIPLSKINQDQDVQVVFRTVAPAPDGGQTGPELKPSNLTVSTSVSGGVGTITPAQSVAEGAQNVSVVCTPGKGSYVSSLYMMRGTTRAPIPSEWVSVAPDGTVTVTLPKVDSDCTVHAVLAMGEKPDGHDPTNPTDPVNPGPSADKTYSISTRIVGGSGATITATQVNIAGGDRRTIEWKADPGKKILSVMVDGAVRDDLLDPAGGAVTFDKIGSDHEVVIQVGTKDAPGTPGEDEPGGNTPGGNEPGGDVPGPDDDAYYGFIDAIAVGPGTVGPSCSVPLDKSATATVAWKADDGARVLEVWVDGIKRRDLLSADSVSFAAIMRSHSVRVVFGSVDPNDPDAVPVPPVEDDLTTISTKVVGGKGTVTGTKKVDPTKTSSTTVQWAPADGYFVKSVTIDGVEYTLEKHPELVKGGTWEFDDLSGDHTVVVRMAPQEVPEVPVNPEDKDPSNPSGGNKPGPDAPDPGTNPGTPAPEEKPSGSDPVVIEPVVEVDVVPGGVITKDDVIKLIEELYPDDPRIPEGVTPTVTITKDGIEYDHIDQSVPGTYLVEVTYVDADGNKTVIRLRYVVSGNGALGTGDNGGLGSAGVGGLGSAGAAAVDGGLGGLAKTGDGASGAMALLAALALASIVTAFVVRRRRA